MTIRPLKATDSAKQIGELFSQLTGKETSTVDVKKLLASKTRCIVICDGQKIIGFGSLVPYYLPTVGEVGKVEDIVVDKNYHGQGLGRKLVEEILRLAQELNLKMLQLTSSPRREAARALYQKLGFHIKDTNVFTKELA